MNKRIFSVLLLSALLLSLCMPALPVRAEETAQPIQIHTPEDLADMAEDPQGDYILMADLDMTGIHWKALDFSGTLDGNGHAIVNLTVTAPGEQTPNSCDGNRNLARCSYFGLFGTLRDAQVKNLKLLNVRAQVEWDSPVFLGGLAGYAENCQIENCTVTGVLELRAHDRIFGVGGLVGYGSGTVKKCTLDVTLISTDTDRETKDEQYLGGICAAGFFNMYDCSVTIDGYISEYGYVHSGGLIGMYMEYPLGVGQKGYIRRNHVSGKITFFECNDVRRAYCKAWIGEALVNLYYLDDNTEAFLRDERDTYDLELRPEMCAQPTYTETVTAPGCNSYGYTTYTCDACGHSFRDRYTLFAHTVIDWTLTKAATEEEEGLSVGTCPCGLEFTRTEPKLEPETTVAPTTRVPTEAPTEPSAAPVQKEKDNLLPILIGAEIVLVALAVILIACLHRNKKRRK